MLVDGHSQSGGRSSSSCAAWELDRYFEGLLKQVQGGVRVVVLRVKRTRNADLVCMERIRDFIEEMNQRKVPVMLSGVRDDFADKLKKPVSPRHCAVWDAVAFAGGLSPMRDDGPSTEADPASC